MASRAPEVPSVRRLVVPLVGALSGLFLLAISQGWPPRRTPPPAAQTTIERQARRFVSLVLTLGKIAPDEVDGYFGPPDIAPVTSKPSLPELRADLAELATQLRDDGAETPRLDRLRERTDQLIALADTMGTTPPLLFDEEARRVYGLPPASLDLTAFARARAELSRLLPGPGSLAQRVEAYRNTFLIPPDRRPALFQRALAECRRRTLLHWHLPASERMDVRWTDTVDAAWHRYRGNFRSTLQINPQSVAFLGSAIDVACHEGYPGHHAQFLMAELAAGEKGLPVEDRVVLLRSPASILREGAADFGVSLVFPPTERLAFARDVLMPMAGLPQDEAARFERIRALIGVLAPAAYPILRSYRDGAITQAAARTALERDALVASPDDLLQFTDAMGAYVAGYTAVREQVGQLVFAPGAGDPWARLRTLIAIADDAPLALAARQQSTR